MAFTRVYILPIVLSIFVPAAFVITYIMAVLNGHVEALFPYISNTGSLSPESCVFAQFINIAAVLILCCVYIRYLQVLEFPKVSSTGNKVSQRINIASLVIGILSCIGFDIVGNFQESNIIEVHMLGAILCFGAGTIYFTIQAWISYKIPELIPKRIFVIRLIIVIICIVFTITTVLTGVLAYITRTVNGATEDYMKWRPEDGGWELHLASAFSEWIVSISYCLMFLTFVSDFHNLDVHKPALTFKKN